MVDDVCSWNYKENMIVYFVSIENLIISIHWKQSFPAEQDQH